MADIRIKDLATTATTTASDDFMAVDGAINGTRKLSAATPAFLTSVTTPSLTSPAATNLTLTSGLVGTNRVNFPDTLSASSATAGAVTIGNGTAATNVAIGGGKVNIGDTTAGSSNAGALIVQGGISAGNTGSAASYFGGAVTVGKGIVVTDANASSGLTLEMSHATLPAIRFNKTNATAQTWQLYGTGSAFGLENVTGNTIPFSISTTGAATFAGAVTVTGALKLGNAYVAGVVVGTGSITIQDSTGTTYRIPVLV